MILDGLVFKMGVIGMFWIELLTLILCVTGQTSGPSFLVTFPAVIQSESVAKLCASLLNLTEPVTMNVYVVKDTQSVLVVQQKTTEEFHRCFNFQAPRVDEESVQTIKVEVKGVTVLMTEERKVMFKPYYPLTFIQTDKPIYTPGQTVFFRAVTMDANFVPLDQMYSLVSLEDSQGNRIGQWANVSSTRWILQLSHDLNPEARQGTYTLTANIDDRSFLQKFEVKKYVLPKFDVSVNAAQTQSVGVEALKIDVCGKYTYNQPVPGKAWVGVCRDPFQYVTVPGVVSLCFNKTVQTNETGCASFTFNTSAFLNPKLENLLQDSLEITANLTEDGTGIVMTQSVTVSLTYEIGEVTLADLPDVYDHGSLLQGKIKVTNYNGTTISNKLVYLLQGQTWSSKVLQNLTTGRDGVAAFTVNTANLPESDLNLMASVTSDMNQPYKTPYFTTDMKTIRLLQPATPISPSYSELTIGDLNQPLKCDSTNTVNIKYSFVGETAAMINTNIVYMVLSRGVIVYYGSLRVSVRTSNGAATGAVSFSLSITADLTPAVQILAYCVLPSVNVVTGSVNFDIEKCFKNKVSLEFSPSSAVPAEGNTIMLSALPGSLCALSAVDQSVLILEPEKRLDADTIFNLLPVQMVSDYPYDVEDEQQCLPVRPRRAVATDSAYDTFKRVGLKVASNLPVREPQCLSYRGLSFYRNFYDVRYLRKPEIMALAAPMVDGVSMADSTSSFDVTVRTVFPETWIWQLADLGTTGKAQVPVKVPDTITTWNADAFCLSSQGFGLAPPANLTAFQPFFLELSLPYSIVRGEIFELKATVFNYLSKCMMVKVTPGPSTDFSLRPMVGALYSACICANGRKTFSWALSPLILDRVNVTVSAQALPQSLCDNVAAVVPDRGRIDTVTRSLLVLAEGIEKSKTYSWLFCPQGRVLSEDVMLTLPINAIRGSAKASVSVLGDVLGRALKNLNGLLKMPYGCGEQNMAVLSPDIYILQYLEITQQLTSDIREKATDFLTSGYQRQLNYRGDDGSFSTFGYGDGNTWLTAFVMRSFGKAQKYIFIDPNVIQSAKDWLISKRTSDGCFILQGPLYHNAMKGGVNDNITMSAYVTASLLELGTLATDPVVNQSLSCLKSVVGNLQNTYSTALLAYTFSLAKDKVTLRRLLNQLDTLSKIDGAMLYWTQVGSTDVSLSVEISSYVLLAVLSSDTVGSAELGYANRIVSWIVKQQNPYGGFSSTQDTVVALQALSLYATKVFKSSGSCSVTLQSAGELLGFFVNQDNKLLYQEKKLSYVPGGYTIRATGLLCVSVQVNLFYNIPTPDYQPLKTLSVDVKLTGDCLAPTGLNLMMTLVVKYTGTQASTNMVVIQIKLLSGFTADTSLLGTPPNSFAPLVERVDAGDDNVVVYLKEVPRNTPMSYQLQLRQLNQVKGLQPALVKIYDYYQQSDQSETTYNSPCP